MHAEVDVNATASQLLSETVKVAYDDCVRFIVPPYDFVQLKIWKPPLPQFMQHFLALLLIGSISSALTLIGVYRILFIKWFPKRPAKMLDPMKPQLRPSKRQHSRKCHPYHQVALMTKALFKGFASFLFDTDGLTFVVDNAANTHVCQDKSLFVGPLRDSHVSLDTATGVNGPQMQLDKDCMVG